MGRAYTTVQFIRLVNKSKKVKQSKEKKKFIAEEKVEEPTVEKISINDEDLNEDLNGNSKYLDTQIKTYASYKIEEMREKICNSSHNREASTAVDNNDKNQKEQKAAVSNQYKNESVTKDISYDYKRGEKRDSKKKETSRHYHIDCSNIIPENLPFFELLGKEVIIIMSADQLNILGQTFRPVFCGTLANVTNGFVTLWPAIIKMSNAPFFRFPTPLSFPIENITHFFPFDCKTTFPIS